MLEWEFVPARWETAAEEHVENVHGTGESISTSATFFNCSLTAFIINLTFLRISENFVGLWNLLEFFSFIRIFVGAKIMQNTERIDWFCFSMIWLHLLLQLTNVIEFICGNYAILTGIEGQVYGMPFWDLLAMHLVSHQEYRNMLFLEP